MKKNPAVQNNFGVLSVASYNIHRWVGTDGKFDPDRTAHVICELGSDIIGLQETDAQFYREENQIERLAEITGRDVILGPTRRSQKGHYGNALLTSLPVKEVRRIDLSVYGREPRGALDVDLIIKGETIRVIVAHLGLSPKERRKQIRRLLDIFCSDLDRIEIMLGDFNEWVPVGRPLCWINKFFGKSPSMRTFPSFLPVLSLDRIWIRPAGALVDLWAHRTELSRRASDHLPIKALINRNVDEGNGSDCLCWGPVLADKIASDL